MAKAIATPGARPVASTRTAREMRSTSGIVPHVVQASADSSRRPEVARLAIEHSGVEPPVCVDGGPFPQQQSLNGQRRIARIGVRAGGIGVTVAALLDRLDDVRRELPAGIRKVIDWRAEVLLEDALGFGQLV